MTRAVGIPAGPGRLLYLVCIAVIVVIGLGTTLSLFNMRQRALIDTERELKNVALILAEHTERTFQAVKLVQISVDEYVHSLGITTPEQFSARMSAFDVHQISRDKISGLPFVEAMSLANSQGRIINVSSAWPVPAIDLSDRPHFRRLVSERDTDWIVSGPVQSRTDNAWTIYIVHKLRGPDGEAIGYVSGAILLDHLEKFFASIALGSGSSISLFQHDGTLLVRFPRIDAVVSRNFSHLPNLQWLLGQEGTAAVRSVSTLDGEDRIFAARKLNSYPISALVATTVWATLADWRSDAAVVIAVGVLACIAVGALFAFIIRDLNRRRSRTEHHIAAQKHQLDVALDHMSQGLCVFDAAGRLVVANKRYAELYGLSGAPPVPGMAQELVDRERRVGIFGPEPDQPIDGILSAGSRGLPTGQVIQTTDGRAIQVVQEPIATGGWVVTHQDVTELRRAEQELDRERQFLDRVIENVPSCIIVKDYAERRFVLANKSTETVFEVNSANAVGKTAYELFDKETADAIHERDEQSLRAGGELLSQEQAVRMPSGRTRYLTSKRICIRQADGAPQYLLNVVEDVTERRLVQHQLQQAQRMEAVGQLTGGLAHDFNNLLHIIIGNLDLLALDVQDNPDAAEKVEAILGSSLRGAELTAQLLAFSRRQSLTPQPLQLNEVLQGVVKLLNRTLGERIDVKLKLARDLPIIVVDEGQLEAALVNIAINARDAMPDGGKLTIETRGVKLDKHYCDQHAEVAPGDFVLIEITDSGTGMPPEVLSRIFEPFYTTKDPGRGTGLGLSMVFGFVQQSGGQIVADSEVGVGTTFRLYLRQSETAAALPAYVAAEASHEIATAAGETILVVEDNATIRWLVVEQLTKLHYRVVEADCAAIALQKLAQFNVDLIFTDMVMPGEMNGKQLAKAARVKSPDLKVLFTSGFPESVNSSEGAKLGANDTLLKKPYRNAELAKAIRKILDQPAIERPLARDHEALESI